MRMREHSAKSAESEYVRILWTCTFTDNFTAKYTENLAHAHAVDTRPWPGDEAMFPGESPAHICSELFYFL